MLVVISTGGPPTAGQSGEICFSCKFEKKINIYPMRYAVKIMHAYEFISWSEPPENCSMSMKSRKSWNLRFLIENPSGAV